MEYTEEQLHNMSDEELASAMEEIKNSELTNQEEEPAKEDTTTLPAPEEDIETDVVEDNKDVEQPAVVDNEESDKTEEPIATDNANKTDSESNSNEEEKDDKEEVLTENDEANANEQTSENEEKETTDLKSDSEANEKQEQKYKFKAGGKNYEFTQEEILNNFGTIFGQAIDYTNKTQAIKPYRKMVDAISRANLSYDDINLMIDVFKGNKDALTQVIKKTGVGIDKDTNTVDLDLENSTYVPKDFGRSDAELNLNEVVESIVQDPEYKITYDVIQRQWDDESRNIIFQNPRFIADLHEHVKSGLYDQISPQANKQLILDGRRKPSIDYYMDATQDYFKAQNQLTREETKPIETKPTKVEKVKAKQAERRTTEEKASKRKAATPTKNSSSPKVIDYLNASDEEFEEWYKKLKDSY